MSLYKVKSEELTATANAIRTKTGGTSPIPFAVDTGFAAAIAEIQTGITPSGTKQITDTSLTDVTNYANAQVADANLVAGNIKKDVTILGTTGTLEPAKTEQSKTLTLGAAAPATVNPDSGKVLSSVPVVLDTSVIKAENIAKDVQILGVTGTHEGSGGGGGEVDSGVIFIDYDGSIVESWESADVASKTALPDNPSHDRLVAQGWNWTLANIKAYISKYAGSKVFVGQMYKTASGLTEFDITVTKVTGLTVTCNMVGNKTWGDGTSDALTTHTYTDYGDYTITCDGSTIPAASGDGGGVFGSTEYNVNRYWCTVVRIGETVTSIGAGAFYSCYSLASITIPDGVTSTGDGAFGSCNSLTSITIPDGVTSIGEGTFDSCHSLTRITIPDGVTSIGAGAFYFCHSLTRITIPDGVTSIGAGAFEICYSLTNVTIPDGVTSIGGRTFFACFSITEYDFTAATAVPTLTDTDAFYEISGICKIVVPDALYDDWIAATNWATYANYIYKASEVTG